ncbi:MAG: hypothetical protein ACR2NR_13510 [Solirubrobacteraceae bacterium]
MSAARSVGRLIRCYPAGWRARFGEELEALILEMSDGPRVPWRIRADVARAGGRERLRGAGLAGDGTPELHARAGATAVLWAWALFVLGGAAVQKATEHWQQAMPAGPHPATTATFTILIAGAAVAGLLVLAGLGMALPSLIAHLRAAGWRVIRGRVLAAGLMTALLLAVTLALAAWAHGLTARDRNGHDTAYAIAWIGWALLGAGTLLAWTAVAAAVARGLRLRVPTIRVQAWLATGVAVLMAVMAGATLVWWVVVAGVAPAALTGGPAGGHASALVPQLIVGAALMLVATVVGATGAQRAVRALPALGDPT